MMTETSTAIDIEPHLEAIAANAQSGRDGRRLDSGSIEILKQAGVFRSFLPKKLGGLEMSPQDFFAMQIKIAEADMSSGWVAGIIACHPYQIALMDDQAQQDVFGDDPDTLVSSSYNPMGGKVELADGGFKLSGRWGWSSGSDHCSWALLGAIVPGEGYRTFLVPRTDYVIEDTWHAMGLQGTGSNDVVIADPVFVPDHRTHKQFDGFACANSQNNPYYDLPWAQVFIRIVCTPAIGAAKHALALFIDNAGGSSTDPSKLMGDPDIQRRVAEVTMLIDETEALMMRNFDMMTALIAKGDEVPLLDRVRFRYHASLVIDKMMAAVDTLFDVAGGRSVFNDSPIQAIWHDIHIARAHVANNPTPFARNLGGIMLGGENGDFFV
ncbi:MAG: flavin-dependent monooxygenase [Alphaproteobacteria bacterium]